MANIVKNIVGVVAAGALAAAFYLPANAAGLGVGASIGGVGIGAGASVGGSRGVSAGLGASVGGSGGVNTGLGASVGGSGGVNAGLGASVGGRNGVGGGVGGGVGIGGVATNAGKPNNPGNRDSADNPSPVSIVANMSDGQVAKFKRRCADVLSSNSGYDRDLRELCLLLHKVGR